MRVPRKLVFGVCLLRVRLGTAEVFSAVKDGWFVKFCGEKIHAAELLEGFRAVTHYYPGVWMRDGGGLLAAGGIVFDPRFHGNGAPHIQFDASRSMETGSPHLLHTWDRNETGGG